jgi:hypothetical protein
VVERNLAKVEVASSTLVSRSNFLSGPAIPVEAFSNPRMSLKEGKGRKLMGAPF